MRLIFKPSVLFSNHFKPLRKIPFNKYPDSYCPIFELQNNPYSFDFKSANNFIHFHVGLIGIWNLTNIPL